MPLASPCLNRQQAQLACSAAGSLRFGYLSQAWAFLLAIAWFTQVLQPLHFTGNYLLKLAKEAPPLVSPKPVTVTHCWLQRTLVPSNVSLAVAGRFMGSFTQKTRFSHFGLQPTASLYHHVRCLTGFSPYGLQPTASYITNFGASLVLATLASGPLLAASSWELLACSSCPPWAPSVSW